jgi:hypothetical protein
VKDGDRNPLPLPGPIRILAGGEEMPLHPTSKKPDATYRHYFHLLIRGTERSPILEYDFERDGTLVDARFR